MSEDNLRIYREALTEMGGELMAFNSDLAKGKAHRSIGNMKNVIGNIGPLPREAALMGVAADGLPVLLNVDDPEPQAILYISDDLRSASSAMKTIIRFYAEKEYNQSNAAYKARSAVVTPFVKDWDYLFRNNEEVFAVVPTYDTKADDLIYSASAYIHSNPKIPYPFFLFLDDLSEISHMDFDTRQSIRYLMLKGAVRHLWVVASMDTRDVVELENWVTGFRTIVMGGTISSYMMNKIFFDGRATQSDIIDMMAYIVSQTRNGHNVGVENDCLKLPHNIFVIKEGNGLLPFFIPD